MKSNIIDLLAKDQLKELEGNDLLSEEYVKERRFSITSACALFDCGLITKLEAIKQICDLL